MSAVETASSPTITACARASSKLSSALGEVFAHQPHALEILPGVQPQTARRPRRAEQSVASRTARKTCGLTPEGLLSSPILSGPVVVMLWLYSI